ncbi:MAG TPA: hypothetical protein DCZ13_02575 [Porticoccaceae bacterium]|nr:hypothetical protein [Porticoccaceae bacterium]
MQGIDERLLDHILETIKLLAAEVKELQIDGGRREDTLKRLEQLEGEVQALKQASGIRGSWWKILGLVALAVLPSLVTWWLT